MTVEQDDLRKVPGGIGSGQSFSNTLPKWFGPPGECGACGCWYYTDPVAMMLGETGYGYGYGYGYASDANCCRGYEGTYALGSSNHSLSNAWNWTEQDGDTSNPNYIAGPLSSIGNGLVPGGSLRCAFSYRPAPTRRWFFDVISGDCVLQDVDTGTPNMHRICATHTETVTDPFGPPRQMFYALALTDIYVSGTLGNFGTGRSLHSGFNRYRWGKPSLEAFIELRYMLIYTKVEYDGQCGGGIGGSAPGGVVSYSIRHDYIHHDLDPTDIVSTFAATATRAQIAFTFGGFDLSSWWNPTTKQIQWGEFAPMMGATVSGWTPQYHTVCEAPPLQLVF